MKRNSLSSKENEIVDRKSRLRALVDRTLTDRFMTELALLLIPSTLLPLIFSFSPITLFIFQFINYFVVIMFALEYILKLFLAKPHWKYALNPWHILDLIIILLAVVDFIPMSPIQGWRGSPLLRLLRLVRVFFLTGRTIRRAAPITNEQSATAPSCKSMEACILTKNDLNNNPSLEELTAAVKKVQEEWIDMQCISRNDLATLSQLFDVPLHVLESKLFHNNFPGIDFFKDNTIMTLWDTQWESESENIEFEQIENPCVVIICSPKYVATLSIRGTSFHEKITTDNINSVPGQSFSIRILRSIFKQKLGDYKNILHRLEKRVAELEEISGGPVPKKFLETTFKLKKIIQIQSHNLRYFSQMLRQTTESRINVAGANKKSTELFQLLYDEADSLNGFCHNIHEALLALIQLQLNKVSFDLSRVMKILAVITCLALVPTIIGGLLGQNLKDQPYNITINEIFFFVISLMLIGLYIFYRKGWLK